MSIANTVTFKDAADATQTLRTIDAESGVDVGYVAAGRTRKRVVTTSAFGVTTTAYASGDVVDTKMTATAVAIRDAAHGAIVNVKIILAQTQPATIPIFLLHVFNDDPSGSTFTDNAALAVIEADAEKYAGAVDLSAFRVLASAVQVFDSGAIQLEFQAGAAADDLFFVLQIFSATTFATDELTLMVTYEQDG